MGELRSSGAAGAGRADTDGRGWRMERDQAGLLARFHCNRDGAIDGEECEVGPHRRGTVAAAGVDQRLSEPDMLLLGRCQDVRRPYMLSTLPPRRLTPITSFLPRRRSCSCWAASRCRSSTAVSPEAHAVFSFVILGHSVFPAVTL